MSGLWPRVWAGFGHNVVAMFPLQNGYLGGQMQTLTTLPFHGKSCNIPQTWQETLLGTRRIYSGADKNRKLSTRPSAPSCSILICAPVSARIVPELLLHTVTKLPAQYCSTKCPATVIANNHRQPEASTCSRRATSARPLLRVPATELLR